MQSLAFPHKMLSLYHAPDLLASPFQCITIPSWRRSVRSVFFCVRHFATSFPSLWCRCTWPGTMVHPSRGLTQMLPQDPLAL